MKAVWTWCAFSMVAGLLNVAAESNKLRLWRAGDDRYQTLVAVIGHHGSCQPSCLETRTLVVPQNVFYKVKVEVAQVDMHSDEEQVHVKVGTQEVTCSPRVASDYNCSLVECSVVPFGRVVTPELRVEVQARKTRDACKCGVWPNGDVDCYSQLLSGLDPTYGALVRLTFEPQVRADWVVGEWAVCSQFDCVVPNLLANRSVQCRIFDNEMDVGAGGDRCVLPAPRALRPCHEAPECQAPPRCSECFFIAHLSEESDVAPAANWSAVVMQQGSNVLVSANGRPLQLQLRLGLAHVSCNPTLLNQAEDTACVSLAKCANANANPSFLSRPAGSNFHSFDDLVLSEDEAGNPQFRMQATFQLRRVSASAYLLADYTKSHRQSPAFIVTPSMPNWLSPSTIKQVADDYNSTCSLETETLTPPKKLCVSDGPVQHMTCADASHGVFGRCCLPQDCPVDASDADANCDDQPRLALVMQGRCEEIRCSPIEEREECQRAAAALGLSPPVKLRLSQRLPSFCSWEFATADNGAPALWLNAGGAAVASPETPQLCRCGEARPLRRYAWRAEPWSRCSRSCGKQQRYRQVKCHELVGFATTDPDYAGESSEVVPPTKCREAGLEEPSSHEPCSTPECWIAEQHTRCAGMDRSVDPSELADGAWVTRTNSTGQHCVALNASSVASVASSFAPELTGADAAAELCRHICSELRGCVGFTFYDHVFGDPTMAQCCFLRRATRWQNNFRRATCHLARGARTRNGCFCQVGWEIDGGSICGAQRRGCCTTPENGARSWCPTTSPGCTLPNQQYSDVCDLTGVAAVSEHTCRTHPAINGRQCASARAFSECNQIATVLGLPKTTPSPTLTMDMPSGCVWQRATSQLWLNQLVDAVNASDPSQKVTMTASEAMSELCSCPPSEEYHWEVDEWKACYSITDANCHGARQRARAVYCVRVDAERRRVVDDALCTEPRPQNVEACSGCDRQVVAAVAEFKLLQPVPGLQANDFARSCARNLAVAARLGDPGRMSVGHVDCCEGTLLRAEIRVSEGPPGVETAANAVDELMQISRSAADRSQVQWEDASFASLMQFFSFHISGTYSWDLSESWGHCSEVCGGGVQSREVWCSWTDFESEPTVVRDLHCDAASRPEDQRSCASRPCKSCPPFEAGSQYDVAGGDQEMQHESKVWVTCAAGYGTVDDIRLVESECKDGEWTPLAVSCGRNCPEFVAASWKYEVLGSGTDHGATRQVTCKRSEAPDSVEAPESASVICQDGAWTTPSLVCTGDCLTPQLSIAYAVNQINGTSGDNIVQRGSVWHISCAPGFAAPQDQASVKLECVRGSWSGLEDIPDCKAHCPRYKLSEGYEITGDEDAQNVMVFQDTEDGALDRRLLNITGVNHGTSIGIRCVDGYGRVPGAVENVECNDGQWSPLSLSCAKDCETFNTSSLEFSRFRVIRDMSRGDTESSADGAPHGSKIIVGCKLDGDSDMKRGEVTCENGRWIPSELRCFRDCAAYVPGPEYSALIPGALESQRNRSVPHGTQLLATCAQGFSALPVVGPNVSAAGDRRAQMDLIAESECIDGTWTDITLPCFPDCPPWPMRQHMVMDSGGGLRVGSLLRLACGHSPDISIRCGVRGTWELLTEQDGKAQVGPEQTAEAFASQCPSSFSSSREAVMNMTFWAKLSDDERAMFLILALGCFGSLCGLACTYFLAPYTPEQPEEDEELADSETGEGEGDAQRRFNLLTGEVERVRRGRRKRNANRIARLVQTNASRLAGYLQEASPRATGCASCDKAATHVCFPCGHLCLCVHCADNLLGRNGRAFQELSAQPSCPLCGQFVFCVIDAKPAKVFDVPGPLDMAVTAATAAASSLRRTAVSAAQGAAQAASRHGGISPTTMGRSREVGV